MLPGKGKHGLKKGKGGKVMPSCSKTKEVKEAAVPVKIKAEPVDEEATRSPQPLPLVRTSENSRQLPRYSAVLTRSKDEGVGIDDLDALQLELESLLSCAAVRHRTLLENIVQLESAEERRDKKSKLTPSKPPLLTNPVAKRAAVRTEERPTKKLKEIKTEVPSPAGKLTKVKGPSEQQPTRDSPKPETPRVVHKNETTNRFWSSVEPYCTQITPDDLEYLADLIRIREEERTGDLYAIPPLGKHYTVRWAEEDLGEELKRPFGLGGTAGPLTQRLVSALVEDNVVPLPEDRLSREVSSPRGQALRQVQSLSFERRVREELREQGILDGDEAPKEQADDELLLEMKRVQSELKALSSHNLQRLRHLQSLAEAQVERQEIKKKLLVIDTELLNINTSKQKKKHLAKKEKDQAWRYIKERQALLKQLYPNTN